MSEELTNSELNWIEGWIDAIDEGHEDPNAVEIMRKMVAALQSAPPASEPSTEALGREAYPQAYSPAPADRPEPSEALEVLGKLESKASADSIACRRNADAIEVLSAHLRRYLSQPAPAVPEAVRQLPDHWRRRCVWSEGETPQTTMETIAAESDYAARLCADELERALAAQPSESPAVPDGYALIRQDVVDFLHGIAPLDGENFSDRQDRERGRYWWRKLLPPFSAAAPAPTEGE